MPEATALPTAPQPLHNSYKYFETDYSQIWFTLLRRPLTVT